MSAILPNQFRGTATGARMDSDRGRHRASLVGRSFAMTVSMIEWLRKRLVRFAVVVITATLFLLVYHVGTGGRVRARYSFVEEGIEYRAVVRERSNFMPLLDWLITSAGYIGFHHPGSYSYRAELHRGGRKIATTGWSGGSESYYERHVSVLSANLRGIEISYGGEHNTDEADWKSL